MLMLTYKHFVHCSYFAVSSSLPRPIHTHTHKDLQVPLLVVWYTPGGGELHVPALLEHSYCMLEGQLEVIILTEEAEQTTSVYQSSHSTLPTLLGYSLIEHTCTELNMRLEVGQMAHFLLFMSTMSHVQCVMHRHE